MIIYRGFEIIKGSDFWHVWKGDNRIRQKFVNLPDAKEKVDKIAEQLK